MGLLNYSDYIIYVDESGDHGLKSIDPYFPVFALAFVIIKKEEYVTNIVPKIMNLKNKYWGHDQIILHENDIRKEKKDFTLLRSSKKLRENFYSEISEIIEEVQFSYFASVIKKSELIKKYADPFNPYEIAMLFCMEHTIDFLEKENQKSKLTHVVIEGRGAREDRELELEFRRICGNQGAWGWKRKNFKDFPFELICSDKKSNCIGLQLADLIVRPIALSKLKPDQNNRALK